MDTTITTDLVNQSQDPGGMAFGAMMADGAHMERLIRFSEIMASGKSTIPSELRNPGDCLAITMQAMAWKMMPQAVAQKCFFLNGKIGYEAQLVAAAINNSGAVSGSFHFDWFGPWENIVGKFEIRKSDKGEYRAPGWKLADEEGVGIRIWATLRGESEPRVMDVLLAQARTRNSTLWADDPKQQLAYLAQKKWARLYAPGVILGVYTPDEIEGFTPEKEINPPPVRPANGKEAAEQARQQRGPVQTPERAELVAHLDEAAEYGVDAYREAFSRLTKEQRAMVGIEEHQRLKTKSESIPAQGGENGAAD